MADGGYGHEVAQWLAVACAAVIGASGGVVAASEGEGGAMIYLYLCYICLAAFGCLMILEAN